MQGVNILRRSYMAVALAATLSVPHGWADESFNAKRFLFQATYGEKAQKVAELNEMGVDAWFEQQLAASITSHITLYDKYNAELSTANKPYARNQAWLHAALNGEDQLRQRMAFALSQILVVSRQHDVLQDQERALASYYDLLSKHALGNYRDLLLEVAKSPVMGRYLDMMFSQKEDPDNSILPNENFAREIMQLMTVGPVLLNDDGSEVIGSDGQPILTYDEPDIPVVAKILSGWKMSGSSAWGEMDGDWFSPMEPVDSYHDMGQKQLFGVDFTPGLTAEQDLELLIDTLIAHPNTAPFISFRLIQRFTTSNPSPEYIRRVAEVFRDNGQRKSGDLLAVIKAILTDSENVEGEASKHKEPLIGVVNYLRVARRQQSAEQPFDFYSSVSLAKYHDNWPQLPLNSPTVFNFYLPTDAPEGRIAEAGLYAPEQGLFYGENYRYLMDQMDNLVSNTAFDLHREYECSGSYNRGSPTENDLNLALQFMSTESLSDDFLDGYKYLHVQYGHNPRERCGSFKFFIASSPEFWVVE